MKGRIAFYQYRLLARFSEILPGSFIRPLANGLARIAASRNTPQRQLVESHLQRVTGKPPSSKDVQETYASYIRYWLHAFRLPVLPRYQFEKAFSSENEQRIFDAREKGKGIIFAVPHLGNWDVAGVWMANENIPLTVVVEKLEPQELFVWFKDFRTALGFNVIVNGPKVSADILAALKRNETVALLCDRDIDGTGADVEFFGEVTKLPKGPAMLAFRSGAALIPVGAYEKDDGFCVFVDEPIPVERMGTLKEDVQRLTEEITHRIESLIVRSPTQWHLFQANWPSERH